MEVKVRRKTKTSKHEAKEKSKERHRARSQLTSDQQWSFTAGFRSILSRMMTQLKQSALFSWLRDTTLTLKQSIMGNRSWPVALVRIGLWLLLLWLLSNLHMGVPCFLLALVFWLYNTYGGGPALTSSITLRQDM